MNYECCVITGGAGFIGCAISSPVADRVPRVIAVDNLHPQIHKSRVRPQALDPRIELVAGDIADSSLWDGLLREHRPDLIVHMAAETGTGQSLTEASRHYHTNVYGAAVMLDAFARHRVVPARMLLTSSRAIYGEGKWNAAATGVGYAGQRSREQLACGDWNSASGTPLPAHAADCEARPVSVYGATKYAQEQLLSVWAKAMGTGLIILRLQNVYGPGQSLANQYTGIVPLFAQLAREGKSIPVYEDGQMIRDFIFIDDVTSAIVSAIECEKDPAGPLDVGTGKAITVEHLAREIAGIYHAPAPHFTGQFRHGDVRHAFCSNEDTTASLSWKPKYDLARGLSRVCAWLDAEMTGG